MNNNELEKLLRVTATKTVYPATPDLTGAVLAGVAATRRQRQLRRHPAILSTPALVGLLLVALVSLGALLITPSREAIARFFGVEGSAIEVVPALPTPATITLPSSPNGPRPVGTPLSLSEIAAVAGFELGQPPAADALLEASVLFYGDQAVVVLQYADYDLWQAQLQQAATFGKQVLPESILLELTVNREPAIWLSGGNHFVHYLDPDGNSIPGSSRTVGRSTLVWRTTIAFYRLETNLSLAEALRIAETLP